MSAVPQTLLFIGIAPALILLYITLKGYDGIYREKTIFIMFMVGITAGVISIVVESFTRQLGYIVILIFPILEQMFKTMILNLRRYQGKRETPIYGLALGVGFGSVFTPYYLILASTAATESFSVYIILFISTATIILHGATGVLLGFGIYKKELMKYFLISILLYIPVNLSFEIPIIYSSVPILIYSLIIYWHVTTKIMPEIKTKARKRIKKE